MKKLFVSIALFVDEINDSGLKLWVQERLEYGPLNGLWEFPGGKIEDGETAEIAMRREVFEEVGFEIPEIDVVQRFKLYPYTYSDKQIYLNTFLVNSKSVPNDKGRWITLDWVNKSAPMKGHIPPINHQIIDEVCDYFNELRKNNLLGAFGGYR